jgi:hypothetical protein
MCVEICHQIPQSGDLGHVEEKSEREVCLSTMKARQVDADRPVDHFNIIVCRCVIAISMNMSAGHDSIAEKPERVCAGMMPLDRSAYLAFQLYDGDPGSYEIGLTGSLKCITVVRSTEGSREARRATLL